MSALRDERLNTLSWNLFLAEIDDYAELLLVVLARLVIDKELLVAFEIHGELAVDDSVSISLAKRYDFAIEVEKRVWIRFFRLNVDSLVVWIDSKPWFCLGESCILACRPLHWRTGVVACGCVRCLQNL